MSTMDHNVLIIGVGNRYRNDDGFGLVVAETLRSRVSPAVTVVECPDDGAQLMELWSGFASVILVDALCSEKTPGTIDRIDIHRTPIPAERFHCSTHAFGVAAAIELARTLHALPRRFVVYGVGADNFAIGTKLSPAVTAAMDSLIEMILGEIDTAAGSPLRIDRAGSAAPMNRYAIGERIL